MTICQFIRPNFQESFVLKLHVVLHLPPSVMDFRNIPDDKHRFNYAWPYKLDRTRLIYNTGTEVEVFH